MTKKMSCPPGLPGSKMLHCFCSVSLCLFLIFISGAAFAKDPARDLEMGVKATVNALKYIRGLPDGSSLSVGILYNGSSNTSYTEAQKVIELIKKTPPVPGVGALSPALVPVANMATAADFDVLYLVHGLSEYYDEIASFSKENRIFNIGLEEGCAQVNSCVVAVKADSGIEIFLNETAMYNTGYDVDAAFRYMARRIASR